MSSQSQHCDYFINKTDGMIHGVNEINSGNVLPTTTTNKTKSTKTQTQNTTRCYNFHHSFHLPRTISILLLIYILVLCLVPTTLAFEHNIYNLENNNNNNHNEVNNNPSSILFEESSSFDYGIDEDISLIPQSLFSIQQAIVTRTPGSTCTNQQQCVDYTSYNPIQHPDLEYTCQSLPWGPFISSDRTTTTRCFQTTPLVNRITRVFDGVFVDIPVGFDQLGNVYPGDIIRVTFTRPLLNPTAAIVLSPTQSLTLTTTPRLLVQSPDDPTIELATALDITIPAVPPRTNSLHIRYNVGTIDEPIIISTFIGLSLRQATSCQILFYHPELNPSFPRDTSHYKHCLFDPLVVTCDEPWELPYCSTQSHGFVLKRTYPTTKHDNDINYLASYSNLYIWHWNGDTTEIDCGLVLTVAINSQGTEPWIFKTKCYSNQVGTVPIGTLLNIKEIFALNGLLLPSDLNPSTNPNLTLTVKTYDSTGRTRYGAVYRIANDCDAYALPCHGTFTQYCQVKQPNYTPNTALTHFLDNFAPTYTYQLPQTSYIDRINYHIPFTCHCNTRYHQYIDEIANEIVTNTKNKIQFTTFTCGEAFRPVNPFLTINNDGNSNNNVRQGVEMIVFQDQLIEFEFLSFQSTTTSANIPLNPYAPTFNLALIDETYGQTIANVFDTTHLIKLPSSTSYYDPTQNDQTNTNTITESTLDRLHTRGVIVSSLLPQQNVQYVSFGAVSTTPKQPLITYGDGSIQFNHLATSTGDDYIIKINPIGDRPPCPEHHFGPQCDIYLKMINKNTILNYFDTIAMEVHFKGYSQSPNISCSLTPSAPLHVYNANGDPFGAYSLETLSEQIDLNFWAKYTGPNLPIGGILRHAPICYITYKHLNEQLQDIYNFNVDFHGMDSFYTVKKECLSRCHATNTESCSLIYTPSTNNNIGQLWDEELQCHCKDDIQSSTYDSICSTFRFTNTIKTEQNVMVYDHGEIMQFELNPARYNSQKTNYFLLFSPISPQTGGQTYRHYIYKTSQYAYLTGPSIDETKPSYDDVDPTTLYDAGTMNPNRFKLVQGHYNITLWYNLTHPTPLSSPIYIAIIPQRLSITSQYYTTSETSLFLDVEWDIPNRPQPSQTLYYKFGMVKNNKCSHFFPLTVSIPYNTITNHIEPFDITSGENFTTDNTYLVPETLGRVKIDITNYVNTFTTTFCMEAINVFTHMAKLIPPYPKEYYDGIPNDGEFDWSQPNNFYFSTTFIVPQLPSDTQRCFNNGVVIPGNGDKFSCQCLDEYDGYYCQNIKPVSTNDLGTNQNNNNNSNGRESNGLSILSSRSDSNNKKSPKTKSFITTETMSKRKRVRILNDQQEFSSLNQNNTNSNGEQFTSLSSTTDPSQPIIETTPGGTCRIQCPKSMISDALCTQCICATQQCQKTTRTFYFESSLIHYKNPSRTTRYTYPPIINQGDMYSPSELESILTPLGQLLLTNSFPHLLQSELTYLLGLNVLPLSTLYKHLDTAPGSYLYNEKIDINDLTNVPIVSSSIPIGIESIHIHPLYLDLPLTQEPDVMNNNDEDDHKKINFVAYIQIQPYTTNINADYSRFQSRFDEIQTLLRFIGDKYNIDTTPYQNISNLPIGTSLNEILYQPTGLSIFGNNQKYSSLYFPSTDMTLYPLYANTPSILTLCSAPHQPAQLCPPPTTKAISSSIYWSKCDSNTNTQSITPHCFVVLHTSHYVEISNTMGCTNQWPYYPTITTTSCAPPQIPQYDPVLTPPMAEDDNVFDLFSGNSLTVSWGYTGPQYNNVIISLELYYFEPNPQEEGGKHEGGRAQEGGGEPLESDFNININTTKKVNNFNKKLNVQSPLSIQSEDFNNDDHPFDLDQIAIPPNHKLKIYPDSYLLTIVPVSDASTVVTIPINLNEVITGDENITLFTKFRLTLQQSANITSTSPYTLTIQKPSRCYDVDCRGLKHSQCNEITGQCECQFPYYLITDPLFISPNIGYTPPFSFDLRDSEFNITSTTHGIETTSSSILMGNGAVVSTRHITKAITDDNLSSQSYNSNHKNFYTKSSFYTTETKTNDTRPLTEKQMELGTCMIPCSHGVYDESSNSCSCYPGYTGTRCEVLQSTCQFNQHNDRFLTHTSRHCSNQGYHNNDCDINTCYCLNNFYGTRCKSCSLDSMRICSRIGTNWGLTKQLCSSCICRFGYYGEQCQYFRIISTLEYTQPYDETHLNNLANAINNQFSYINSLNNNRHTYHNPNLLGTTQSGNKMDKIQQQSLNHLKKTAHFKSTFGSIPYQNNAANGLLNTIDTAIQMLRVENHVGTIDLDLQGDEASNNNNHHPQKSKFQQTSTQKDKNHFNQKNIYHNLQKDNHHITLDDVEISLSLEIPIETHFSPTNTTTITAPSPLLTPALRAILEQDLSTSIGISTINAELLQSYTKIVNTTTTEINKNGIEITTPKGITHVFIFALTSNSPNEQLQSYPLSYSSSNIYLEDTFHYYNTDASSSPSPFVSNNVNTQSQSQLFNPLQTSQSITAQNSYMAHDFTHIVNASRSSLPPTYDRNWLVAQFNQVRTHLSTTTLSKSKSQQILGQLQSPQFTYDPICTSLQGNGANEPCNGNGIENPLLALIVPAETRPDVIHVMKTPFNYKPILWSICGVIIAGTIITIISIILWTIIVSSKVFILLLCRDGDSFNRELYRYFHTTARVQDDLFTFYYKQLMVQYNKMMKKRAEMDQKLFQLEPDLLPISDTEDFDEDDTYNNNNDSGENSTYDDDYEHSVVDQSNDTFSNNTYGDNTNHNNNINTTNTIVSPNNNIKRSKRQLRNTNTFLPSNQNLTTNTNSMLYTRNRFESGLDQHSTSRHSYHNHNTNNNNNSLLAPLQAPVSLYNPLLYDHGYDGNDIDNNINTNDFINTHLNFNQDNGLMFGKDNHLLNQYNRNFNNHINPMGQHRYHSTNSITSDFSTSSSTDQTSSVSSQQSYTEQQNSSSKLPDQFLLHPSYIQNQQYNNIPNIPTTALQSAMGFNHTQGNNNNYFPNHNNINTDNISSTSYRSQESMQPTSTTNDDEYSNFSSSNNSIQSYQTTTMTNTTNDTNGTISSMVAQPSLPEWTINGFDYILVPIPYMISALSSIPLTHLPLHTPYYSDHFIIKLSYFLSSLFSILWQPIMLFNISFWHSVCIGCRKKCLGDYITLSPNSSPPQLEDEVYDYFGEEIINPRRLQQYQSENGTSGSSDSNNDNNTNNNGTNDNNDVQGLDNNNEQDLDTFTINSRGYKVDEYNFSTEYHYFLTQPLDIKKNHRDIKELEILEEYVALHVLHRNNLKINENNNTNHNDNDSKLKTHNSKSFLSSRNKSKFETYLPDDPREDTKFYPNGKSRYSRNNNNNNNNDNDSSSNGSNDQNATLSLEERELQQQQDEQSRSLGKHHHRRYRHSKHRSRPARQRRSERKTRRVAKSDLFVPTEFDEKEAFVDWLNDVNLDYFFDFHPSAPQQELVAAAQARHLKKQMARKQKKCNKDDYDGYVVYRQRYYRPSKKIQKALLINFSNNRPRSNRSTTRPKPSLSNYTTTALPAISSSNHTEQFIPTQSNHHHATPPINTPQLPFIITSTPHDLHNNSNDNDSVQANISKTNARTVNRLFSFNQQHLILLKEQRRRENFERKQNALRLDPYGVHLPSIQIQSPVDLTGHEWNQPTTLKKTPRFGHLVQKTIFYELVPRKFPSTVIAPMNSSIFQRYSFTQPGSVWVPPVTLSPAPAPIEVTTTTPAVTVSPPELAFKEATQTQHMADIGIIAQIVDDPSIEMIPINTIKPLALPTNQKEPVHTNQIDALSNETIVDPSNENNTNNDNTAINQTAVKERFLYHNNSLSTLHTGNDINMPLDDGCQLTPLEGFQNPNNSRLYQNHHIASHSDTHSDTISKSNFDDSFNRFAADVAANCSPNNIPVRNMPYNDGSVYHVGRFANTIDMHNDSDVSSQFGSENQYPLYNQPTTMPFNHSSQSTYHQSHFVKSSDEGTGSDDSYLSTKMNLFSNDEPLPPPNTLPHHHIFPSEDSIAYTTTQVTDIPSYDQYYDYSKQQQYHSQHHNSSQVYSPHLILLQPHDTRLPDHTSPIILPVNTLYTLQYDPINPTVPKIKVLLPNARNKTDLLGTIIRSNVTPRHGANPLKMDHYQTTDINWTQLLFEPLNNSSSSEDFSSSAEYSQETDYIDTINNDLCPPNQSDTITQSASFLQNDIPKPDLASPTVQNDSNSTNHQNDINTSNSDSSTLLSKPPTHSDQITQKSPLSVESTQFPLSISLGPYTDLNRPIDSIIASSASSSSHSYHDSTLSKLVPYKASIESTLNPQYSSHHIPHYAIPLSLTIHPRYLSPYEKYILYVRDEMCKEKHKYQLILLEQEQTLQSNLAKEQTYQLQIQQQRLDQQAKELHQQQFLLDQRQQALEMELETQNQQ